MTWLVKRLLTRIPKGVAAAWFLAAMLAFTPPSYANNWGEMAMVSETMGISDGRICIGEGSRGDLGCPSYAPTISPTGRINASAGLTVDSVSLTTTGTTWGYLSSAASYLPNLSSNAVSATNISATTINGIAVSAFGSSSGTVISGTTTMVEGWPDAIRCTISGYTYTFLQAWAVAGGAASYRLEAGSSTADVSFSSTSANGVSSGSFTVTGCGTTIADLYYQGRAFNFIGNSGAGGGALGDRITSGTTSAVASPAGTIDVSASLRVNGSIQVTGTIQLMSASTAPVCTLATIGTIAHINGRTYECRM